MGKFNFSGLRGNDKSCRMRCVNYLRPDLKRGNVTPQEERLIIQLQSRWGNTLETDYFFMVFIVFGDRL